MVLRDGVVATRWIPLVYLGLAALALGTCVLAFEGAREPGRPPPERAAAEERALTVGAAACLVTGAAAMVAGWWKHFHGWGEWAAVFGALVWTWAGYASASPQLWLVAPGFLLPWLALFVELEPRQRAVLLGTQWLSSIMLLETLNDGAASTMALSLLAIVHLLLVWGTMPEGRWRLVPFGVAVAMATVAGVTTLYFILQDATVRRWLALLPAVGLMVLAFALRRRGPAWQLPVLVPRRAGRIQPA